MRFYVFATLAIVGAVTAVSFAFSGFPFWFFISGLIALLCFAGTAFCE